MSKWQGIDLQEVYADWSEQMQDFSLGAINHGIEVSKKGDHPPSQGEFIKNCRGYKPPEFIKIGVKLTPEQIEKNKQRIAEIARNLAKSNKGNYEHTGEE